MSGVKKLAKYIPNILTLIRFLIIPIIVIAATKKQYLVAIIWLTISGITDILDGFIARKYNFITNFGKLIDPVADKATQIAVLASLVFVNIIPLWILLIVVSKEFVMVSGASFLYGKDLVVSSRWYGKLSTVLFYVAIVVSLALRALKNINLPNFVFSIDKPIYYLAILSTIFSLVMYIKAFFMRGYLKEKKEKTEEKI